MIEDIQLQSSMQQLENNDLNREQIESARATVTQIAAVVTDYRTALGHIVSNKMLSIAGKAHDTADLKTSTDNRLAQIGDSRLETLDARISELEYQTRPQAPDSDPVVELLRQQEIRAMLIVHPEYGDELQLISHYNGLAVSGENDLFMRSVEQSPLPLISDPAIIEDGKIARGARTNKDAALTLRQLRTVRGAIKDSLDTARAELSLPDLTIENIATASAD